jgi:hypothetical protein
MLSKLLNRLGYQKTKSSGVDDAVSDAASASKLALRKTEPEHDAREQVPEENGGARYYTDDYGRDYNDALLRRHLTRHKFNCPCCGGNRFVTVLGAGIPIIDGSGSGSGSGTTMAVLAVACEVCGHISLFSRQVIHPTLAFADAPAREPE